MSDAAKLSLTVLQRVAEFLDALPENDLVDLAEGRASITFYRWGEDRPVKPAKAPRRTAKPPAAVDLAEVREALATMDNREAGRKRLAPLTVATLRSLAGELDMGGLSKETKARLVDKIVERTIGYRLNSAAIRQL